MVQLEPSFKKFHDLHLTAELNEKSSRKESADSLYYLVSLLVIYYDLSLPTISNTPEKKDLVEKLNEIEQRYEELDPNRDHLLLNDTFRRIYTKIDLLFG